MRTREIPEDDDLRADGGDARLCDGAGGCEHGGEQDDQGAPGGHPHLKVPLFVVITKVDLSPPEVTKKTTESIVKILKQQGRRR